MPRYFVYFYKNDEQIDTINKTFNSVEDLLKKAELYADKRKYNNFKIFEFDIKNMNYAPVKTFILKDKSWIEEN